MYKPEDRAHRTVWHQEAETHLIPGGDESFSFAERRIEEGRGQGSREWRCSNFPSLFF
jgi:hypothetical protein